jgi:hypothetical protein
MKRAATLILCLVTVAVGLWVMNASRTLDSACTLNVQTGGGSACDYGLPFNLLGIALTATGVASTIIALSSSIRTTRRKLTQGQQSAISTLPQSDVESLREVA